MRLLILGGTQFVGRYLVEEALARGHTVTLFNRGRTHPELFPQAEKLRGDRDGGLEVLRGRSWDAAIDVNGYLPRLVSMSAELLKDAVEQYVYISSGSVYDFNHFPRYGDENAPLEQLADETTEDFHGPAYGGLKVLCERVVQGAFPGKGLILRLGVVAGPFDPTDRVTYWIWRVAQGGEVLAPAGPEWRIQFIDARDMARFALDGIEKRLSGVFNLPGNSIRWADFLDSAWRAAERPEVSITWVEDSGFLSAQAGESQRPFGHFPGALPADLAQIWTISDERALAEGLTYRSTLNTAWDVLAWARTRPDDHAWQAGLGADLERSLLAAWKAHPQTG
jgi:2'-hydroxyisoflavone reductase